MCAQECGLLNVSSAFCVARTVAENLCSKTWIVDAIVVMGLRWGEVRLWEVAVVGVRCHFFV